MSDTPPNRGRGRGRGDRGDRGDRGGRGGRGRGRGGSDSAGGSEPAHASDSARGRGDRGRGDRGRGDRGRGDRGRGDRGRGDRDGSASRGRGRGGGGEFELSIRGGRGGGHGGDDSSSASRGGRGRGGRGAGRGDGGGRGGFKKPIPEAFRDGGHPEVPEPDGRVRKLEDGLFATAAKAKAKASGQDASRFRFPHRPAYGREGTAVKVWANYFELAVTNMPRLFLYTMQVRHKGRPEASPGAGKDTGEGAKSAGAADRPQPAAIKGPFLRNLLKHVVQVVLNDAGLAPRTELKSKLVTMQAIPADKIRALGDVEYDGTHFAVDLDGPITLDMDGLRTWLNTMHDERDVDDTTFPKFQDLIDAIGIIIGHGPRMGGDGITSSPMPQAQALALPSAVAVGSNRFFPVHDARESRPLHGNRPLEILRGYFQSVRPATGRLLLNVNVTHAVFRHALGVPFADLFRGCHFRDLEAALKGARVRVAIPGVGDKEYTVAGFVLRPGGGAATAAEAKFRRVSEVQFAVPEGSTAPGLTAGATITVQRYLALRYGTEVADTHAVQVGRGRTPTYYPAGWCTLLPGQPWNRKLSGEDTSTMITFACRRPADNATSIMGSGRQTLQLDSAQASFRAYAIEVGTRLITVSARVLPTPTLTYRDRTDTPERGSWNLDGRKFLLAGDGHTSSGSDDDDDGRVAWAYFDMPRKFGSTEVLDKAMGKFGEALDKVGLRMGTRPARHAVARGKTPDDTKRNVTRAFEAVTTASGRAGKRARIVLVVLGDDDKSVYEHIKQQGDLVFGVHTVCVLFPKFTKNIAFGHGQGDRQYFANVALKFNLKLGGINHRLADPGRLGVVGQGETMVVGYDIIHPTNLGGGGTDEEARLPSHVGLVASVDEHLAQWPAVQWAQTGRQEMASGQLQAAMGSRLALWAARHGGRYPKNILVYRDGVSEGQFAQVLDVELPQMQAAAAAAGLTGPAAPRITIVVSVKRHNTRFFPADQSTSSTTGNVACGTVVDRGVTLQRYWDFFLTAHTAIQGTARPARYTVIYDEIFGGRGGEKAAGAAAAAAAGELERITYNMCYLFNRATKAVSICPPAYYADLVCTRARLYQSAYFGRALEGQPVRAADRALKAVHPALADDMYYI